MIVHPPLFKLPLIVDKLLQIGAYLVIFVALVIQRRLQALAAFPSLILAQSVDGRYYERKRNVSYLTIDWQDRATGRQQLVFEMHGKRAATVWANYLEALRTAKQR